ncbi:hypothetical protein LXJ15735_02140 [Lacrimispora xylanolytica]
MRLVSCDYIYFYDSHESENQSGWCGFIISLLYYNIPYIVTDKKSIKKQEATPWNF